MFSDVGVLNSDVGYCSENYLAFLHEGKLTLWLLIVILDYVALFILNKTL